MNKEQIERSNSLLGEDTVNMLIQVHEDALWILENLGVGCKQPEIQKAFQGFEADGLAVVYEDRAYITSGLVKHCLKTVPGLDGFFVPMSSFFIGGTAPMYTMTRPEGAASLPVLSMRCGSLRSLKRMRRWPAWGEG